MQETKKEKNLFVIKHHKNWNPVLDLSANDSISEITANISKSIAHSTDAVILRAIIDSGSSEMTLASKEEIQRKGSFEEYPDKTKIFFWDGKPLIKFLPVELKQEGLKITASQPYYLLFHPVTKDSPTDVYLNKAIDNISASMKESIDAFILEEVIKKA